MELPFGWSAADEMVSALIRVTVGKGRASRGVAMPVGEAQGMHHVLNACRAGRGCETVSKVGVLRVGEALPFSDEK
jgi:hypothetical protein